MVAAFEKQKTTAEIAEILKMLYHGGNGLGSVSAWYNADLEDISQRQEKLWEGVKEILTQLSKLS